MSKLSLKQAAEWAGTTKPTVLKHLQAGKVSAEKDEEGRWWFDVSELRRAYGEPKSRTVSGSGSINGALNDPNHPALHPETPGNALLVDTLRHQIEELKEDKADLRRRLDEREEAARETEHRLLAVIEKQAEQVTLLTDQRAPATPEPVPEPSSVPAPRRGAWAWLMGR
jgi:hypothetical protein